MRGARGKGSRPIVLATGLGLAVALGVALLTVASERRVARLHLENRVADEISFIDHEISNDLNPLVLLRVVFESSALPIGRDEFRRLALPMTHFARGMQLLGWAPRVVEAERDAFEHAMRESGLGGFEIRDRSPEGGMVQAPDRSVYYPLLYEEAAIGTAFRVLGWDLRSNQARVAAIDKAVATTEAAATPPYAMPQPGRPMGLIAYMPVFRSAVHDRKEIDQPDGVVFAIYELAKMLDRIVSDKNRLAGLDMYLLDPMGAPGHRLAYWRTGDGRETLPPDEDALRRLPHVDAQIKVFDQTLDAIVMPVGALAERGWTWEALAPSGGILFLTAVIVVYLVLSSRRALQFDAMAESLRDTTDGLRQKAAMIAHMARHDALTGLPNRIAFAEALARTATQGTPCAILQIGVDRLKGVNEFHGHAAGDSVLREVARRIRAATRSAAVVARLGGDEFAVMVEDMADGQGGTAIGRRLIDAIGQPIDIDHGVIVVGASIGAAFSPADGADAETLLRAADLAMDSAKQKEPGSLCHFDPSMHEQSRARLALEADLRHAIEAGDIRPHYQPVIRLRDASLVGVEILARWHHPERGIIMPDSFVGLAESLGLIADMTYGLLRLALADARAWPAHLYLALNISPLHLRKTELSAEILSILRQTGTDPMRLEVEITESALVSSMDVAKRSLLTLQRAGVNVALDDFGTGYSSLVHLRQLPLNKIKIDRSFVSHLLEDRENHKIVAAIVGLGKSLGIATTAEGIETKDVALSLAGLGCDFGQGYFFAKPMTADAVARRYGFAAERLQMSGGSSKAVLF